MKKIFLIVCVCVGLTSSAAFAAAIPTKEECKAAREKLSELTSDDYKALKTKTNEEVGDALVQYADNEESAAGKFALLQDAFLQYVLGKNVDKAESVYAKAQTIGGVEYALEMARPSRYKLSAYATAKNPQAKALKERIVEDEKSFQRVGIVKAKLKKAPGDESLCEQLGIEYAAIGDWESALAAFVTAAGEVAKVADWELGGGKGVDYTAATVGAFWWNFADNFERRRLVQVRIRLHAATWYNDAIEKDQCKGNETALLEKRIAAVRSDARDIGIKIYLLKAGEKELPLVRSTDVWQCLRMSSCAQSSIDSWCAGNSAEGIVSARGPFAIGEMSTLLIRKFLNLEGSLRPAECIEFCCKWDDDIVIFVNGKIVFKQGFCDLEMKTFRVPASMFNEGKNIIAAEVVNKRGDGCVDISIKAVVGDALSSQGRTSQVSKPDLLKEKGYTAKAKKR